MDSGPDGVSVIGVTGRRLMPTTPRKARLLLETGKATVFKKKPFTIQRNYRTGGNVQEGALAFDTGRQNNGAGHARLEGAGQG